MMKVHMLISKDMKVEIALLALDTELLKNQHGKQQN